MEEQNSILTRLNEIDFHDIPVERISFKTKYSTDFTVDFALYDESRRDYDYWRLNLVGITELNSDCLILNSNYDIEITSFDYSKKNSYEGRIMFLLGFGNPSFAVEFKCSEIELIKIIPNNK